MRPPDGRRRRGQSGQALLETAITIPLMLVVLLGFLAVLVRVEAQVELDTATSLAAAAAVTAPAGSSSSFTYADRTWTGTLRQYSYLQAGTLSGCGAYRAGDPVTCHGSATLDYRRTPMGLVVPFPIRIDSFATAHSSVYRSR
jgi:hypothetical protein